ncbi:Hypothetical protein SMAX5B_015303, partial [Scophthalmus maximus]
MRKRIFNTISTVGGAVSAADRTETAGLRDDGSITEKQQDRLTYHHDITAAPFDLGAAPPESSDTDRR